MLALAVVQSWESVPVGRLAVLRVPLALTRLVQVPLLAAVVVAAVMQEGRLPAVVCREVRPTQLWWQIQWQGLPIWGLCSVVVKRLCSRRVVRTRISQEAAVAMAVAVMVGAAAAQAAAQAVSRAA